MSIVLGFEIPTGRRVEIPDEGHAAFFGQTQLSGKTTLIEAITYRAPANLKAVAFITKRGEGSFLTARMIPPYFSEPSNDPEQPLWRWVSAILEASQQRKLRFEESWIIRACEEPRRAKSLADVQANITALVEGEGEYLQKTKKKRVWRWIRKPVTGINQGVYTSLKAYFDIVMPQLKRMPYTKTLKLGPGLSVMDLREYSMEAQGMVIRSVMEYVYEHERNTRVIVPEAQDFVPQGKNSPVKMACETMVRKGAADKNFMWLDSQDMAAVDKVMLRAVSILGVGVQGEVHEMGRAIAHLFGATTKLTARDIGSLKVGQFFLRLAGGDVTKVYVQPAWMDSEVHAKAIAMGQEPVSSARQILRKFVADRKPEDELTVDSRKSKVPPPPQMRQIQESPDAEETAEDSGRTVDRVHDGQETPFGTGRSVGLATESDRETQEARNRPTAATASESPATRTGGVTTMEDVAMRKDDLTATQRLRRFLNYSICESTPNLYDSIVDVLKELETLREAHDAMAIRLQTLLQKDQDSPDRALSLRVSGDNGAAADTVNAGTAAPDLDNKSRAAIYEYVKARAAKDPGILQLLAAQPELRLTVQRPVLDYDDSTIIGKIARLLADGYFKEPKNGPTVQKELKRRGCDQPTTNLYKPLNRLTEQGFLTLEPDGYQAAPGMKIKTVASGE